jgi:hypothetical protein
VGSLSCELYSRRIQGEVLNNPFLSSSLNS